MKKVRTETVTDITHLMAERSAERRAKRRTVSRADTERRMMIHSQKNDSIRVDNEHLDWKKSGDGEAKEGEADARTWRS